MLVAERQILDDAIGIGGVYDGGFAEAAAAFRVFGLGQMPATSRKADGLAGGGDFKPFCHGFLRFDAFGTTHKIQFNFKRARNLRDNRPRGKLDFLKFWFVII
jgi:hypothetical protein